MVKFMCKHSGTIFEFTSEHDINEMRLHSEYEEIKQKVDTQDKKMTLKKQKSKEE